MEALEAANLRTLIQDLPEGIDSIVGDNGNRLSGGQRQRLAIARAFYGTPKYIVMDEPNANLDELGESVLAQAVDILKKKGCAIIITTHRPRLVSVVNNLLVLRAGRQVGFGPADDMINAVRNLQVVGNDQSNAEAQEVEHNEVAALKEGSNDAPVEYRADTPSAFSPLVDTQTSSNPITETNSHEPEVLNTQLDSPDLIEKHEVVNEVGDSPANTKVNTQATTQDQPVTEQAATQIQESTPTKEAVEISDDAAQALGLAELLGGDAEHQGGDQPAQINEADKPQAGTAV